MIDRDALLKELRLDAGHGEHAPERISLDFYPIDEHLRALDPSVVLIVGDRGAGKSKLVLASKEEELRNALFRRSRSLQKLAGHVQWKQVCPIDYGPNDQGLRSFVASHRKPLDVSNLWFAYLTMALANHFDEDDQQKLKELVQCPPADPDRCFEALGKLANVPLLALDRLDQTLDAKQEWICLAYDELDTLVVSDWDALGRMIQGLIQFWVAHARRWKRIRAKIFLRSDFYHHHGRVMGSDLAKLSANRVELTWSDKHLYGALIKQIANLSDAFRTYCEKGKITFEDDSKLGAIPILRTAEDAHPFVNRFAGQYMGPTPKKGSSFRWMLDHIRDGNDKASPRSLVQLVDIAAAKEQSAPKATRNQLLHHTSLRNALNDVSERHVSQAKASEWRWLQGIEDRLAADRNVPWSRKDLEKLLKADWTGSWGNENVQPPAEDAQSFVDRLIELGIVRQRGTDRFDVPDLYLAGLKLRRRGGVALS